MAKINRTYSLFTFTSYFPCTWAVLCLFNKRRKLAVCSVTYPTKNDLSYCKKSPKRNIFRLGDLVSISFRRGELAIIQLMIKAAEGEQGFVGALLYYIAVPHYENKVCGADS